MQFTSSLALTTAQTWAIVVVAALLLLVLLWYLLRWRPNRKRNQQAAADRLFKQSQLGSWAHKRLSQWTPDERRTALRYYNTVGRQARMGAITPSMVPKNHHATIATLAGQERDDEASSKRWGDLIWLGSHLEKNVAEPGDAQQVQSAAVARESVATTDELDGPPGLLSATSSRAASEAAADSSDEVAEEIAEAVDDSSQEPSAGVDKPVMESGSRSQPATERRGTDQPSIANEAEFLDTPVLEDFDAVPTPDALAETTISTLDAGTNNDQPTEETPVTDRRSDDVAQDKPTVPTWILDARREIDRTPETQAAEAGTSTDTVAQALATDIDTAAAEPALRNDELDGAAERVATLADALALDKTPSTAQAEPADAADPGEPATIDELAASLDDLEAQVDSQLADAADGSDTASAVDIEDPVDPIETVDLDTDEIDLEIEELETLADSVEQNFDEPAEAKASAHIATAVATTSANTPGGVHEAADVETAAVQVSAEPEPQSTMIDGETFDSAIAHALRADDELRRRVKKLRRRANREQEIAIAQRKLGDRRMEQGRKKKAKAHYESAQEHLRTAKKLSHKAKKLRKRRENARRID